MCNQLKEADPSAMSDLFFFFFLTFQIRCVFAEEKAGTLTKYSNLLNFDMMPLTVFLQCDKYTYFTNYIFNVQKWVNVDSSGCDNYC